MAFADAGNFCATRTLATVRVYPECRSGSIRGLKKKRRLCISPRVRSQHPLLSECGEAPVKALPLNRLHLLTNAPSRHRQLITASLSRPPGARAFRLSPGVNGLVAAGRRNGRVC